MTIKGVLPITLLCLISTYSFSQNLPPQINPKKLPTKIENRLEGLFKEYNSLKKISSERLAYYKMKNILIIDNKVKIEAHLRTPEDTLKIDFLKFNIEKDDYFGTYQNIVQFQIPIENLKKFSEEDYVLYLTIPPKPQGDVVSEGVKKINADIFHDTGLRGDGIKIAIIDLGFDGYKNLLGSELPANVTTKSFYNSISGNGDITGKNENHGTAVAEVVHDVAPDAQLYLINFDSRVELDAAVNYAINQNVHIINHSVGHFSLPFDGTGAICDIARKAINNGILWVNSAGNHAKKHYEDNFKDPDSDGLHNFDNEDETLNLDAEAGDIITIYMTWDDWPYSSNDYDLSLGMFDDNDEWVEVENSTNLQLGIHEPVEIIDYAADITGTYHIAVQKLPGALGKKIEIYSFNHGLQYISEPYSLQSSIIDPASAEEVLTVGATNNIFNTITEYSSQGPTNDGRIKPDIAAPAEVVNSTLTIFSGTSASTPHVSGAAALLLEEDLTRNNKK